MVNVSKKRERKKEESRKGISVLEAERDCVDGNCKRVDTPLSVEYVCISSVVTLAIDRLRGACPGARTSGSSYILPTTSNASLPFEYTIGEKIFPVARRCKLLVVKNFRDLEQYITAITQFESVWIYLYFFDEK